MLRFTPHLGFLLKASASLTTCSLRSHPFRVKLRGGVHRVPPLSSIPLNLNLNLNPCRVQYPNAISETEYVEDA
jgi:hypothetical protein